MASGKVWDLVGANRFNRVKRVLTLVAAVQFAGCAANTDRQEELILANQQPVQSAYVGGTETLTGYGVHLVKAWSSGRKAKSVGTIRPAGKTWPVYAGEANCGATFISDRHAITAAHCVDKDNLPNVYGTSNPSPFRIEQVDTTNLNLTEFNDQKSVTGTWPNWTRNDPLSTADGYAPVTHTCYVKVRCDSTGDYGRNNCPASFGSTVVDIALVYCPNRSTSGSNWSPVATSDSRTEQLEVWWFHEVVNLATQGTVNSPYQPTNNWDHYFWLGNDRYNQNYHYKNATQNHQLLPLVSYRSSAGVNYRGVEAADDGDQYTKTNVPACHGTSGSGVFKSSAWNTTSPELLGPLVKGSDDWVFAKLCAPISTAPGATEYKSAYAKRIHSANLQALSDVQNDR
jgi:hypothetical protein